MYLNDYADRYRYVYNVYFYLYCIYSNITITIFGDGHLVPPVDLHMYNVEEFDITQNYSWEYLSSVLENMIRELDPDFKFNSDAEDIHFD